MSSLLHGDSLDILPTLAEHSIDAVVTDPPYELGFMGKGWDSTGIAYHVDLWRQVLRVLKPGGHLVAFGGARTYHRMACAIEDAGFEVRDQLMWIYGSGFPKSHNLHGDWDGWGTALKPAHEPICLARKPFPGTVAANVAAWGTGAMNTVGCAVGTSEDLNPRDYDDSKRTAPKFSGAYRQGGAATRSREGIVPAGRWPANVLHDGSDEVLAGFPVTERVERRAGTISHGSKTRQIYGGFPNDGDGLVTARPSDNGGSAARFFYAAKASPGERNAGCEGMESLISRPAGGLSKFRCLRCEKWIMNSTQAKRRPHSVCTCDNPLRDEENIEQAYKQANFHPTVKPLALMRWLCRLITPPGGLVLDPFLGSGSTGCAAALEGFDFLGIEREAEYLDIARARIAYWSAQAGLFARQEVTR